MRLAHHLLRHASGVFHFRLIVPVDLQPLLGRRVIKKSLGPRNPTLARWRAYTLGARYAQLFATARSRGRDMAILAHQVHLDKFAEDEVALTREQAEGQERLRAAVRSIMAVRLSRCCP